MKSKSTVSDASLVHWANVQRRMFHAGRLSEDKIQKLEVISGWTWDIQSLPADPPAEYRSEWKGWNDFLGVDPTTTEGRANSEQDILDVVRANRN